MSANAFFFFLRACGEAAVGSTFRTCVLRQSLLHTRGWILSASDGIWNMLFSTYPRTSHWVRFNGCLMLFSTNSHTLKRVRSGGCLSLLVAQASTTCCDCLRRSPNCLLSLLIMCTAVSEEAASDILVGAQPRIMCRTRARSSSMNDVDLGGTNIIS